MEKETGNLDFLSSLFSIINCSEYWRVIRWCHRGTAIDVPNPRLFEREVLKKKSTFLKASTFAGFVDQLLSHGFRIMADSRSGRHFKFEHPNFRKEGLEYTAKEKVLTSKKRCAHGASSSQNKDVPSQCSVYSGGEVKSLLEMQKQLCEGSVAGMSSTDEDTAAKEKAHDGDTSASQFLRRSQEHVKLNKGVKDSKVACEAKSKTTQRKRIREELGTTPAQKKKCVLHSTVVKLNKDVKDSKVAYADKSKNKRNRHESKRNREELGDSTTPAQKKKCVLRSTVVSRSPPFPHDKYCLPDPRERKFTLQDPTFRFMYESFQRELAAVSGLLSLQYVQRPEGVDKAVYNNVAL